MDWFSLRLCWHWYTMNENWFWPYKLKIFTISENRFRAYSAVIVERLWSLLFIDSIHFKFNFMKILHSNVFHHRALWVPMCKLSVYCVVVRLLIIKYMFNIILCFCVYFSSKFIFKIISDCVSSIFFHQFPLCIHILCFLLR